MSADDKPCPNCGAPACEPCECSQEDRELAELGECTGQDVRDRRTGEMRHAGCAWGERSDWEGDPSIPKGVNRWTFAKCATCGADVQQPYPDWLRRKLDAQLGEPF